MPRLHQVKCCPETCIPDEQLVSGYICVDGQNVAEYKLLVGDTCGLYLGNIITIHFCHARLVYLCIQQQTGDKLATILNMVADRLQDTCRRYQVDTNGYNLYSATCVLV